MKQFVLEGEHGDGFPFYSRYHMIPQIYYINIYLVGGFNPSEKY
jgi:hypothetical protein